MDKISLELMNDLMGQSHQAAEELIEKANLRPGSILVVGCSTSEVMGGLIGKASNMAAAEAMFQGIRGAAQRRDIFLAAQCCEHLNRALIVERECGRCFGLEEVCVMPQPKAGGSFATVCWERFEDPVAVEHIRAHAGMDIGGTLIGMHLKEVAVPVRLSISGIGQAILLCARTRPKYIGGSRAVYP